MTTRSKLSPRERQAAVNSAALLEVDGTSITGVPVEWAVRPERIAEVLRTHSCCIPHAMSGWSATVPMPTTWAGWWLARLTHAQSQSGCGMAGRS